MNSFYATIDSSENYLVHFDASVQKYYVYFDKQPYYDFNGEVEGKQYARCIEFEQCPSPADVKCAVSDAMGSDPENMIVNSFVYYVDSYMYRIYLSLENQMNYFSNYVLATQTNGANLPYKIKCGDQYTPEYLMINTIEEFTDFYYAVCNHITTIQTANWNKKDNIDWDAYAVSARQAYLDYVAFQEWRQQQEQNQEPENPDPENPNPENPDPDSNDPSIGIINEDPENTNNPDPENGD